MQTDLFFVFDLCFIVLIDECIRFCVVDALPRKTAEDWMKAVFVSWIRLFGPPRFIVTDQEGATKSDLVGKCCERFNITRDFGGSQGHAAAPLAEPRIEIIRLGSQKLWSTVVKQGLRSTEEEVVMETAMATNLMLTYGGATPHTGVA